MSFLLPSFLFRVVVTYTQARIGGSGGKKKETCVFAKQEELHGPEQHRRLVVLLLLLFLVLLLLLSASEAGGAVAAFISASLSFVCQDSSSFCSIPPPRSPLWTQAGLECGGLESFFSSFFSFPSDAACLPVPACPCSIARTCC